MRDRLILLPGWGLSGEVLEPLAAALSALDARLHVSIEPLPYGAGAEPEHWLDELDSRLPDNAWLGGWSLGGMLATALAARRGERCHGVFSLASNACFVACQDWPQAMSATTFDAFLNGCRNDPDTTLKRFAMLCAQGSGQARQLGRQLSALTLGGPELADGLEVLAKLDNRAAIQAYQGPQLHLLAGTDALVPASAAQALLALQPDIEVGLIAQAAHAFVLEEPRAVSVSIDAFLHECNDE